MKPTIGRIVHFLADDGDPGPYAGIIVHVHADEDGDETLVDLVTFGPNSFYHNHDVPFSESPRAGFWSWPPRES